MPARLQALCDDGIDPVRLEPECFFDGGRRGEHLRAQSSYSCQQLRRRQTEMETHHGGPEIAQRIGGLGAERRASRPGGNARWIDPVLLVERRKRLSPGRFAPGIRRGRDVAEEVHVEWLAGLRLDFRELAAHGIGAEHGAGQRAETARVAYGHRQRAALRARHGRLDDRKVYAEELGQFHGFNSIWHRASP